MFDLSGTLVTAPTPEERARAASRLATVIGCDPAAVEHYFRDTWHIRHDGTLPTPIDPAAHVVRAVHGPDATAGLVTNELRILGRARLMPAPSVVYALKSLRGKGVQLGILSDASAATTADRPARPRLASSGWSQLAYTGSGLYRLSGASQRVHCRTATDASAVTAGPSLD